MCVKFKKGSFLERDNEKQKYKQFTWQALSHQCGWKVNMAVAAKKANIVRNYSKCVVLSTSFTKLTVTDPFAGESSQF